nr:hypothetical protein [Enterobacter cloacae]
MNWIKPEQSKPCSGLSGFGISSRPLQLVTTNTLMFSLLQFNIIV